MREVRRKRARPAAREFRLTTSGQSVTRRQLLLVPLGAVTLGVAAARPAASIPESGTALWDVLVTTEDGHVLSGENGALLRA